MSRANRILVVAFAAIVVLTVVAAVLTANRPGASPDPASPEAAVQTFIRAALDGRGEDAARLLAPGSDCDATDIANQGPMEPPARVALVDSSLAGDTATVIVHVTYSAGSGPFDPGEFTDTRTYHLTRSSGSWLITGVPWPLFECLKE